MGASKNPYIANGISHVLIATNSKLPENDKTTLIHKNPNIIFCNIEWLRDCYRKRTILPIQNYLKPDIKRKIEEETSISKKVKKDVEVIDLDTQEDVREVRKEAKHEPKLVSFKDLYKKKETTIPNRDEKKVKRVLKKREPSPPKREERLTIKKKTNQDDPIEIESSDDTIIPERDEDDEMPPPKEIEKKEIKKEERREEVKKPIEKKEEIKKVEKLQKEEKKEKKEEFKKPEEKKEEKEDFGDLDGVNITFTNGKIFQLTFQDEILPQQLFGGFDFYLHPSLNDTDKETIKKLIQDHSGKIVEHKRAKYIVCHCYIQEIIKDQTLVTLEWITDCIEHKIVHDVTDNQFYKPYYIKSPKKYIITSNEIHGDEKENIKKYICILGGEYHARITKMTNYVISNMINPSNSKVQFSHKYNIPIISPEWIFDSFQAGGFLDFEKYSLEKEEKVVPPKIVVERVDPSPNKKVEVIEKKEVKLQESPKSDSNTLSDSPNSMNSPPVLLSDTNAFADDLMKLVSNPKIDKSPLKTPIKRRKKLKKDGVNLEKKFEKEIEIEKEKERLVDNPFQKLNQIKQISKENQLESQVILYANNNHQEFIDQMKKIFLFSGFSKSDIEKYEQMVKSLGGICVSDVNQTFTHLIVHIPMKSAKFMAALAGGKWILQNTYITQSLNEKKWVSEKPYEWNVDNIPKGLTVGSDILKLISERKGKPLPFQDWFIYIPPESVHVKDLLPILKTGGAKEFDIEDDDRVDLSKKHLYVISDKANQKREDIRLKINKFKETHPEIQIKDQDYIWNVLIGKK